LSNAPHRILPPFGHLTLLKFLYANNIMDNNIIVMGTKLERLF